MPTRRRPRSGPILGAVRPPSVDALARSVTDTGLPHPLLVDCARQAIAAGDPDSVRARATELAGHLLGPVVNATGVLLHTNMGRAPRRVGPSDEGPLRYSNLEIDITTGDRGSRQTGLGHLLARLTGAEAAIVVNNCAAAVTLVLAALAAGTRVPVSRGELVEIGGGFRIPEVMAQSGARLVEVGTTNRTRRSDYEAALDPGDPSTVVLKIHPSNYRIQGFTEEATISELAGLAPDLVVDLGSGLVDRNCQWLDGPPPGWLGDEPGVRQTLAAGADIVTFSGDKLFGGPQAGIIVGRADLVDRCARHPLMRAFRPGGLVMEALQETTLAYLRRDGDSIPFWRTATIDAAELRRRARDLGVGDVIDTEATPGAGSLPLAVIPSAGIALSGDVTAQLRRSVPPIVARVVEGRTVLDLRTVDPADDEVIARVAAEHGWFPGSATSGRAPVRD